MTVPALPRFLTILSRDDVHVLRNMRRSLAASWLRARYPDMDAEDMGEALALAPEVAPVREAIQPVTDPLRNLFIAGAWLAGASINKLAMIHGLSRQRAMEIVHRGVPGDKATRASMRVGWGGGVTQPPNIAASSVSGDHLALWRDAFYTFAKATGVEAVAGMEPLEVALILPHLPGATLEPDDA